MNLIGTFEIILISFRFNFFRTFFKDDTLLFDLLIDLFYSKIKQIDLF